MISSKVGFLSTLAGEGEAGVALDRLDRPPPLFARVGEDIATELSLFLRCCNAPDDEDGLYFNKDSISPSVRYCSSRIS